MGFPHGDTQCPSVNFYPVDVRCPGPIPSSDLFNRVCDLCLFSKPDSSLNLLVLVFVSGAVSLSQVDVALNVLNMSFIDVYRFVVFHHHLCLRRFHLQTLIFIR